MYYLCSLKRFGVVRRTLLRFKFYVGRSTQDARASASVVQRIE